MKKFVLICCMISVFLCGCESLPEDTGYVDYEKMDKKFGQTRQTYDFGDDSVQYEAEMEQIKFAVETYVDRLIRKDVAGCVADMPIQFLEMIAMEKECDITVANGFAISMVEVLFYTKEQNYRDIEKQWSKDAFEIALERIDIYPQRETLRQIYSEYNVSILDAIDISIKISGDGKEKTDNVRLVKLETGEWKLDLSFIENQ